MERKKKATKDNVICVRMTEMERLFIKSRASKLGMSMSSYLLNCGMNKNIKLISDEEKKAYQELANYRTNFERISNLIKNRQDLTQEVKEVIQLIDKSLKKIW